MIDKVAITQSKLAMFHLTIHYVSSSPSDATSGGTTPLHSALHRATRQQQEANLSLDAQKLIIRNEYDRASVQGTCESASNKWLIKRDG